MRRTEYCCFMIHYVQNKTVKFVNLIKVLDKMVDFRGNAALRGVERVLLAYFACLFSITN